MKKTPKRYRTIPITYKHLVCLCSVFISPKGNCSSEFYHWKFVYASFLNYILLIMLLQLYQFSPFAPLHAAHPTYLCFNLYVCYVLYCNWLQHCVCKGHPCCSEKILFLPLFCSIPVHGYQIIYSWVVHFSPSCFDSIQNQENAFYSNPH